MDGTDPRDYQASPVTDVEASISSGAASGKGSKMPSQGGEIMDIEYFSDHAEVDESEGRTRWVPWALLAALIVAAVVAAVVIIRFAVKSDDGTQSSASKRVDLNGGQYTNYQDCAGMMARLRPTSLKHEFLARTTLSAHQTRWNKGAPNAETVEEISTADGQHDVLVPLLDDIINLGDARKTAATGGYIYTSSGTQLKVLSVGDGSRAPGMSTNTTSVVATLDFAAIGAFNDTNTDIEVFSGQGSLKIPYGLGATFQVEQLFLPSRGVVELLAVVGSATNAAPAFPGPSPKLIFESRDGAEYVSEVLRPFNSTVVALVNVSEPTAPAVVSISEFEGDFVTIAQEQSHYWVFVKSSAHVPENHESSDDSKLTMDIMPLFRNLPLEAETTPSWGHMGRCVDVSRLELGVPRVGNNYLLASIAMLVKRTPEGRKVGEVRPDDISLSVQGWVTEMVPVLTAPGPDRLNLYLAEAIRYTPQATGSTSEADSSVITAISHFRLSGNNMSYSNYTVNIGQAPFQGAMHFLQDPPRLSLMTSQYGGSTGGPVRSSLTVYSPSLSQESQSVGQFREREPTGVIYPTDDHVFISFTVQSRPLVQVLPTHGSADAGADDARGQDSRRVGPLDRPQQGVQRLPVRESVDLMKALVVDNNDTSLAYILLIAGQAVPETDDATGATGGPSTQPGLSRENDGQLQFSLYSYTPGASSNIAALATVNITSSMLESEAFLDPRAALLFQVPNDVEGHAYFALPVMTTTSTNLLDAVGCLGGFSGILIWRLAFTYMGRNGFGDDVAVQPLAAIPAWGSCGYETDGQYQDVAVKRIRMLGSDGEPHLAAMSRCTVATVAWKSITAPVDAADLPWPKFQPQTEELFVEGCLQRVAMPS